MTPQLDELVSILTLDRVAPDVFRGSNQDLGWGGVLGGQLVGQALAAAYRTVDSDFGVHSLHSYFVRRANPAKSLELRVQRIRDGRMFAVRRVVVAQDDGSIFELTASFQRLEDGFEHQARMPSAPPPETIPTEEERFRHCLESLPPRTRAVVAGPRPFDARVVEPISDPIHPERMEPQRQVWLRARGPLPDDSALHRCLLAYATDHYLISTSLLPHGKTWLAPGVDVASLDHAVWFHRPFRADEWLLHVTESPTAQGARGFAVGRVFAQTGELVASTAQEGVVRIN